MNKYLYTVIFIGIFCFSCTKEVIQHKLTIDVSPLNGGTVSPPSNSFDKGSKISLFATPSGEYTFKQWIGSLNSSINPTSLTIDSDMQVTSVFEKRQYPLTINIIGNGTVKEEIISIATQSQYPSGTTVKLTPQPLENYEFTSWSGDVTNTNPTLELKITKAVNLTANFILIDSDKDGVPDLNDKCANTPSNSKVNASGCSTDQLDNDGDGFPVSNDCNDNDKNINPNIPEIPGDGKDNNCDGFIDSYYWEEINKDELNQNGEASRAVLGGSTLVLNYINTASYDQLRCYLQTMSTNGSNFNFIGNKIYQYTESMDISDDGKTLVTISRRIPYDTRILVVWKLISNNWVSLTSTSFVSAALNVKISGDGTTIGVNYLGLKVYKIENSKLVEISNGFISEKPNILYPANYEFSKDGKRILIGFEKHNPLYDPKTAYVPEYQGIVRYYEIVGGQYSQVGADIEGDLKIYDKFGYSISMSDDGDLFAISVPNKSIDFSLTRSAYGLVKVFRRSGAVFELVGNQISELANAKYKAVNFGKKIMLNGKGDEITISSDAAVYSPYLADGLIQTYKFVNGDWKMKADPILPIKFNQYIEEKDLGRHFDFSKDGKYLITPIISGPSRFRLFIFK